MAVTFGLDSTLLWLSGFCAGAGLACLLLARFIERS